MTTKIVNYVEDSDLEVDKVSLQQVHGFKYLGVNMINRNWVHDKIKLRLKAVDSCRQVMSHLFVKVKINV